MSDKGAGWLIIGAMAVLSLLFAIFFPDYQTRDDLLEKIEYYQNEIDDLEESHREEIRDLQRLYEDEISYAESSAYDAGYEDGRSDSYMYGYEDGHFGAYEDGYDDGFDDGYENGWYSAIDNYHDWLPSEESYWENLSFALYAFWGADDLVLNDYEERLLSAIEGIHEDYLNDYGS